MLSQLIGNPEQWFRISPSRSGNRGASCAKQICVLVAQERKGEAQLPNG
jgi:hypothetical protein